MQTKRSSILRAAPPGSARDRRPAFAMLMVKVVVAVAAVLALALLYSTTLQAKASTGRSSVVQAELLAESGLNRASYYIFNLKDPTKCPFTLSIGNTYSENNVSLGNSVPGNFDLSIERMTQSRYRVVSTGKATSGAGTPLRKRVTAFVDINYTTFAAQFEGNVTIPAGVTIDGDVLCNGDLVNNGNVTGVIYAKSVSGSGTQEGTGLLDAVGDLLTGILKLLLGGGSEPSASPNYYMTYKYNGVTYLPKNVFDLALANKTLGPTPDNPAGVFRKIGTLDLNGNVRINGTLVVMSGSLRVQGANNVITPAANFPALILDNDITFKAANATLDVNGLMWFGGKITKTTSAVTNAAMKVTGTMVNPGHGATTFDPVFGTVNVKYDRLRSLVKDWNTANPNPPPVSITIVDWKNE
jgi:hypothetical protein